MAWCPKCKNEYVEGIFVCADCKVELVEDLKAYERENCEQEQEAWEPTEEELEEARASREAVRNTTAFVKKEEKAQDHKSSALTLIIVGVLGILVLILYWLGIIPLYLNETSKYMITIVMGGAFILFIVMGIQAARSGKRLQQEGQAENKLEAEIFAYCKEALQADKIDNLIVETEEAEEMKYFKRMDIMKAILLEKYPDTQEEFIEHIVDEIYAEIFE